MARRWFSRKSLTAESEAIYLIANDMTSCTLNTHRILTDLDISTGSTTTVTNTPVVDTGAITTISPSTFTLKVALTGNIATLRIPAFNITAVTGSPTVMNLTGASGSLPVQYRPPAQVSVIVQATNNGANGSGLVTITTGGQVHWQIWQGTTVFTPAVSTGNDTIISWLTV
jgi:hypothetical protein